MRPRATYRLQFHRDFPFAAGKELAPYLARLGISHVYASPITTARAGSLHGYDVVDPTRINPELGGEDGLRDMVEGLRAVGLGVVVDIVPNHMAVGGADNPWWLDMLEGGESGPLAAFFDVDWRPDDPTLGGKVLAPFLGASYAQALAAGDIVLRYDPEAARLSASTPGGHLFPLRREDYAEALRDGPEGLAVLYDPLDPEGRGRLHALLERQHFRLASWRTAGDEINWRRFFDVTELAGLRTDRPEVFQTIHAKLFALYAEGLIDGVRVDHVDGLADPAGYCRSLRERLDGLAPLRPPALREGRAFLVVEKILAEEERLSPDWRTDGTTGYDYMELASALLHAPRGEEPLTAAWARLSGRSAAFAPEAAAARLEILTRHFAGQLDAAAKALWRLAGARLETRDLTFCALRRVTSTLLCVFPCYRTYAGGAVQDPSDPARIATALSAARPLTEGDDLEVLERVGAWLGSSDPAPEVETLRADAVRRLQQLSSPVAAKAVEDTAFYRYARLLSRNDVGFDPARFSLSFDLFHERSLERARTFPGALLATATHDHKRGEDVRARLAVLSEIPELWIALEESLAAAGGGAAEGIDRADLYALHQTLLGAMPFDLDPGDGDALAAFLPRVDGWLVKSLREAKLRSSWSSPNEAYEGRCRAYLARSLKPAAPVLAALCAFRDRIGPAAALNGVAQAFLRCLVPGVPDLYQGAELWDLSLVDPDNRRPVDFTGRRRSLEATASKAELTASWRTGALKQRLIAEALRLRSESPALFEAGAYLPLVVDGPEAGRALAFLRHAGDEGVLVAVALRCAEPLLDAGAPLPPPTFWGETAVLAPAPFALPAADGGPAPGPSGAGLRLPLKELFAESPARALRLIRRRSSAAAP